MSPALVPTWNTLKVNIFRVVYGSNNEACKAKSELATSVLVRVSLWAAAAEQRATVAAQGQGSGRNIENRRHGGGS